MRSKTEIVSDIDRESNQLDKFETSKNAKFKWSNFFQFVGFIILIYAIIFGFKTAKTILTEVDSNNKNYVTYKECIDAETDWDGRSNRTSCNEYRIYRESFYTRVVSHLKSSLLIPICLLVIFTLFAMEEKGRVKSAAENHKNKLIELYAELKKLDSNK